MTELLEAWHDFNVAMAGASVALAGLVIVAASVNIERIVRATTLTARLGAAIAALLLVLVVSAVGLIPEVHRVGYGTVVLVSTALAGWFQFHATRVLLTDSETGAGAAWGKSLPGLAPLVAYLIAGVLLVSGDGDPLVFTAAGALLAIVSAVTVSWVALVEVLR